MIIACVYLWPFYLVLLFKPLSVLSGFGKCKHPTTVLSTETDHNLPSSFSLESYRTLIDSRIIEESDREIRKYRETSENRNMMYQNQWDAAKVVLRGKCIAIYMAVAPDSSTLAWKIPRTEEPGRLQSMGLLRVGHD